MIVGGGNQKSMPNENEVSADEISALESLFVPKQQDSDERASFEDTGDWKDKIALSNAIWPQYPALFKFLDHFKGQNIDKLKFAYFVDVKNQNTHRQYVPKLGLPWLFLEFLTV